MERRDSKGRILFDGEAQRQDGRYSYRFTGPDGARHTVYSWRLEKKDKAPDGKADKNPSLREQEKQIQKDIANGIKPDAGKQTLNEAIEAYFDTKGNLRVNTLENYRQQVRIYVKDTIGRMRIRNITFSDVVKLYADMRRRGVSTGTIKVLNTVLIPVFNRAVRDGILRLNPAQGAMREITAEGDDKGGEKKFALTREEQEMFFAYMDTDAARFALIRPLFDFMIETGVRPGEACALQLSDIDLKAGRVSIERTLLYQMIDGRAKCFINQTKTEAGKRQFDLSPKARKAVLNAKKAQMQLGLTSPTIDGCGNFVFLNSEGTPFTSKTIGQRIRRIVNESNAQEAKLAEEEHREPRLIRQFGAHALRHTFATRCAERGMSPVALKTILGHSDIGITMNIYVDNQSDYVSAEFQKMWAVQ